MYEVSLFRLYLLRAAYLFIAVGLSIYVLPDVIQQVIDPTREWEMMEGVVACMQAALCVLCFVGLRYPLKMLPLLVWEMVWKAIWLLIVALPLWMSGEMDEATWSTAFACFMGIVAPIAMPWRYLFKKFASLTGDRWK
ncbi:hypothetical protein [Paenibacillus methanolicus]|uniref:Uncharacterized protein n=1 Tax=Paenibacillus methanolicus TaxID=582686 RepID=A0A5S5CJJ6_9BACL|nr:hypothetical protein [Paenibacillus methanolicus]TYP79183.1 hypothetical protein BCM02_101299 [Paenibacillus methanolicus]